ncbi:MAG: ABC transporter permease [Thaumarchaeota archaeon]|nr:ABC transporter permease [Nitrososphaerota archaeon]
MSEDKGKEYKRRSAGQWAVAWRRFKRNKSGLAGSAFVGAFFILAFYGLFAAPYPGRSFACLYQGCANLPPFQNWAHPLGTETSGIDVWSEIAHGAAGDLYVGVAATLISVVIGLLVGAVAGYRGGIAASLLLGLTQVFFVLPILIIILLFAKIFLFLVAAGLGLNLIVFALAIFGWPVIAFIARGEILRIRELEFVQASRALGASNTRILFRHIVPNMLSPIIVIASLSVAGNILTEVIISFLGFGDATASTWGNLLFDGFQYVRSSWWVSFFPGIAVVLCVLGFNLLGDGLSDALNPRLRE